MTSNAKARGDFAVGMKVMTHGVQRPREIVEVTDHLVAVMDEYESSLNVAKYSITWLMPYSITNIVLDAPNEPKEKA